ncbi:cation-transporting ATPase [Microbacterium sp. NPDC055683]
MGKLKSIINLAKKAMDSSSPSSSSRGSSQSDWMTKARGAVESLLGDDQRTSGRQGSAQQGYAQPAPRSTGLTPPPANGHPSGSNGHPSGANGHPLGAATGSAEDRAAIARYDYLLQTARPDQIEQVHRDAFARLSPEQRAQIAERMRTELPPYEQPRSYDAPELARVAARTEAAQPGRLRGLLARTRGVGAAGGLLAGGAAVGGVLAAVAGGAILTSIGSEIIGSALGAGVDFEALAEGVDVSSIAEGAGGLAESASGLASEAGEFTQGFGDIASDFGLGDLFGR